MTMMLQMMIYLAQTFEWMAILYLIRTQKDRRVEEILHDHETENILLPSKLFRLSRPVTNALGKITTEQKTYRRNEIKLQTSFRYATFAGVLVVVLWLGLFVSNNVISLYYYLLVNVLACGYELLLFVTLHYIMMKYHNYEYERTKHSYRLYTTVTFAVFIFNMGYYCIYIYLQSQ